MTPSSLNVTVGAVAKFNCTSATASSLVWLVNGSEVELDITKSFTPEDGGRGTILMIDTMSATTNTTIQCVAIVLKGTGSDTYFSDVAVLMVQGDY